MPKTKAANQSALITEFEIEGECDVSTGTPPSIKKAISILDGLNPGKLLTSTALASRIPVTRSYFSHQMSNPALDSRKIKLRSNRTLYGNPKTIAAARAKFSV